MVCSFDLLCVEQGTQHPSSQTRAHPGHPGSIGTCVRANNSMLPGKQCSLLPRFLRKRSKILRKRKASNRHNHVSHLAKQTLEKGGVGRKDITSLYARHPGLVSRRVPRPLRRAATSAPPPQKPVVEKTATKIGESTPKGSSTDRGRTGVAMKMGEVCPAVLACRRRPSERRPCCVQTLGR